MFMFKNGTKDCRGLCDFFFCIVLPNQLLFVARDLEDEAGLAPFPALGSHPCGAGTTLLPTAKEACSHLYLLPY